MIGYLLKSRRLAKGMDQQTLCRGVCSVSYLSKIENGRADAGEDVLRLLFGRLGIEDWSRRPRDGAAADALNDYFERTLLGEDTDAAAKRVRALLPGLEATELELDGRLFAVYDKKDEAESRARLAALAPFREDMTPRQRMLEAHAAWVMGVDTDGAGLREAEKISPCWLTALDLAGRDIERGAWQESLRWARAAFDRSSAAGCVHGMREASMAEGTCYANLYNIPLMRSAYARTAALSRDRADVLGDIAYNTGATLLEVGDDRAALPYLLESYRAREAGEASQMRLLTCHKLALCFQRLHRREEGEPYLREAEEMCGAMPDEGWALMIALVRRRYSPGYLDDPAYGDMLRRFCQSGEFPRGYVAFHERMLEEWLTHQRRYKEAYELIKSRFPDISE